MRTPNPAPRTAGDFLSADNMSRLGTTIESFLFETYKIQLKDTFEPRAFEMLLRDIMMSVDASDDGRLSLQEKNKLAIVTARNIVFEQLKAASSPQPHPHPHPQRAAASFPATLADDYQPQDQPHPQPPLPPQPSPDPLMPSPIERVSTKPEDNDALFFKRLQELEQKRSASVAIQQTLSPPVKKPPAQPARPIQAANSDQQAATPVPAPAPSASQQVIVAVPPAPRRGSSIVISSWDRSLADNLERSSMQWTGQLPASIDLMGTRITGIFMPVSVYGITPYIVLAIDGAGGNHSTCILSPDASAITGRTRGWMLWSPMNDSLSYTRNVPSPWTIHTRAADGSPLPLGLDHCYILTIAIDITNRTASLVLSSVLQPGQQASINDSEFQAGDQVWIITKSSIVKTDVLSVSANGIDVRYKNSMRSVSMSNAAHEWMNCRVLNYSRQWSLVLDVTSTEHTNRQ